MFTHGGSPLYVVAATLAKVSGNPDTCLFAEEDFRNAAVMQASLGGNLSR